MKATIIKYGMYGFGVGFLLFLAALVLGKNLSFGTQEVIGYLSIIISLSFVFFGIKYFRDTKNDGKVTFKTAFIIGIFISLFASAGFAIVDFIYTSFINPEFIEQYLETMKKQGHEGEMPNNSSGFLAAFMFLTVLTIGFIITLISALILKKTN